MPTRESEYAAWTAGALIMIKRQDSGDLMVRPAAFVWALPDGIEWIEPSYADPWGAATTAYHERRGRVEGDITFTNGEVVEALPFDPETDQGFSAAEPLIWFARHLNAERTNWTEERARLRALLDSQATASG
jgi:hypothetical protein